MQKLPTTTGRWAAITRGKTNPQIVAWIEVFKTRDGVEVTIPGVSRYVPATLPA